jgi:hypothetical protein
MYIYLLHDCGSGENFLFEREKDRDETIKTFQDLFPFEEGKNYFCENLVTYSKGVTYTEKEKKLIRSCLKERK